MNGDLTNEVQRAIFRICSGHQPLTSIIDQRIFDFIPQKSEFPYLRIGEIVAADGGTKSSPGEELTVTFHIWSRERSNEQISMIKRQLVDLFHEKQPILEEGVVSLSRFIGSTITPDSDGISRHGVVRFRMVTFES